MVVTNPTSISLYTGDSCGLAVSPDSTSVVIAGRSVFKIYSCYSEEEDRGLEKHELVRRRSFKETLSLRPAQRLNLNYSCTDVAWSWSHADRLATSASNGAVVIWNLAAASTSRSMEHVFHDHSRTAHKVHFSPVDANLLASCSQDSTVRVYDVRMSGTVMTIGNENAGDPIRDVQFNPLEQPILAGGYENGHLHIWDMRRADRRELVFPAHSESILAIDWHPELRHWISTAGRDKCVKVWLASDERSIKQPDTVVPAIAPASAVRWRPGHKSQIASGCMHMDFAINVCDIRRPYVPQATFNDQLGPTTGIAWRDKDGQELISASRDGYLFLYFHALAPRPADSAPPMALGVDVKGGVTLAQRASHRPKNVHVSAIEKHMSYIPLPPPPPPPPHYGSMNPSGVHHNLHYSVAQSRNMHQRHSSISAAVPGGAEVLMPPHQVVTPNQPQHKGSRPLEDRLLVAPASQLSYFSAVPQGSGRGKGQPPTDMDWFAYSAKNYRFRGASIGELCDANASVCDQLDRHNVSLAWRNFKVLFDEIDVKHLFNCLPPELQREHLDLLSSTSPGAAAAANRTTRARHHSVRGSGKRNPSGGGGGGAQAADREQDLDRPSTQPESDNEEEVDPDELEFPENELTLTSGDLLNKLSPGEKAEGTVAKGDRRRHGGDQGGSEEPSEGIGLFVQDAGGQQSLHVEDTEQDPAGNSNNREGQDQFHTLKDATDHDQATAEQFLASVDKPRPIDLVPLNTQSMPASSSEIDGFLNIDEDAWDASSAFISWDPCYTARDTLCQYAELGDVQSAVIMYLVLGHERLRKVLKLSLVESWFHSYINLLQQQGLFNESVQVIQACPLREVRLLHDPESTNFYTNCSTCSKAMVAGEGDNTAAIWVCKGCKRTSSRCSVCNRRARGILSWCQGCGHGGHLACMRSWWQQTGEDGKCGHSRCPIGCNHFCQHT